jgi:hypothetical protein
MVYNSKTLQAENRKSHVSLLISNYVPPLDTGNTCIQLHFSSILVYRANNMAMATPKMPAAPSREAALPLSSLALLAAADVSLVVELVGVVLSVALPEAAFLSHLTSSGRSVTPEDEQICLAYLTAVSLPSASHFSSRQHAIPERKSLLLQMHLMSSWPHPATPPPVVYLSTQGC